MAGLPGCVDEVDDGEHGAQAVRELMLFWDAVGNPGGLDLALGTCETGRHGGLGDQEGACDLLGRKASKQPEGKRYLRFD